MEGRQKSRRCRKQDGERGGQDGKERLAMENIGCGWRGVCVCVWMAHFQCSPSTASDSTASHAACPFKFVFLTSDSTLDTRLSLNARRICSVTPQHRYSSTSDSSHPTRSLSLGYPSTLAQLRDR
ncbi:hypothetical protein AYX14_07070 [Cryptococcus neoformans]|nr:hypothetical protein AYX14_07070 [Cryptococcus neoformans var. grubii]